MRPLADEIRPQTLDEVAGQKHLLGQGALLRRLIENGTDTNLIFYGPSGTGKTTVANIIAKQAKKTLYYLNATTASLQDVKNVIGDVGTMMAPNGVLLYLDEIQYFNKKQQQSLLEFLENGKITMIASTTENPYFYIYNALLSRSTVFEFKPLTVEETIPAVERALRIEQERSPLPFTWEDTVPRTVASGCGGDVRKAINAVELLYRGARTVDGGLYVTRMMLYNLASAAPCATTGKEMTTTTCCRRCKSPSVAPTLTRRCTIWDGCWWRGICCRPVAGCWSSRRRISAWPTHRALW